MAGSALRRLMAEHKQLSQNPPDGIAAGPTTEENFFEWEAAITGPCGTYFEDGVFIACLSFPQDYPLNPPKMKFKSELFHPNIYPDGRVCISILHPPGNDPLGYESSSERWSPVQSIEKILLSVMSMLAEPNTESPANVDAAKMWREDRQAFKKRACQSTKYLVKMTTKAATVHRMVKPLLSMDNVDARVRVLSLYKAWYRHIPFMVKDFHFPRNVDQCRDVLRAEFRKNANVRDIRTIDMLVIKGQQDLKEVVEHWKQNNHIMAKWFKEDYIEEKPKDFVGKFLAGHE